MTDSTSSLATPYLNIEYMSYFAAIALSCYDYGLTLEREIRLVWRRGFSTSSILYYAVRYSAVLGTLSCIVDLAYHNNLLMRR
ncbi:hypothetical protein GY45DRAFT_254178 [Cubamyces sp. BRFM 1775]|nr:hypothetical protein GY45DRAFT_254178 [Cubamyces sp. BRFM 1775]